QCAHHRLEAAAIGIGFHPARAFDRHRHAGELLPIARKRAEVDRKNAARFDGSGGFGKPYFRTVQRHAAAMYAGTAAQVKGCVRTVARMSEGTSGVFPHIATLMRAT